MKKKVAILRGGPSSEHEVSLKTGTSVLKHLSTEKYLPIDVYIDLEGVWHINGLPIKPHDIGKMVDVVFVALHGEYGEDGKVQKILEDMGMPFTGSKSLASAIGMNKALAKNVFKQHGLKIVHHKVVNKADYNSGTAGELFRTFPQPSVIKPVKGGSSVGTSIAHTIPEIQAALEKAFAVDDEVLVEEFIKGKEATCGVLENYRGKEIYSLFPIEIVPPKQNSFYDYAAKYNTTGGAEHICPGNFTDEEDKKIQEMAILAHKAIGARHYSRSDFIVHPKRGIYILEINTLPGMTETSLIPDEMRAIGASFPELLDHLLTLALSEK